MSWVGLSSTGPSSETLQGKIVHGGTFNGNEKEGKKEETLTAGEGEPRTHNEFHRPLERSTS
jgi:hypothetical protein